MDLVARLPSLLTHVVRLSAFEVNVLSRTKGFDHGIKALTRPWHQLTKPVDGDPTVAVAEAVIGVLKLLTDIEQLTF